MVAKGPQCPEVRGHGVSREVARDHCLRPFALLGDGVVHAPTELRLDVPEPCPHAVTSTLSLELEDTAAGCPTDVRESQEREDLCLTQRAPLSLAQCMATELQKAGLVPVKLEPELLEPRSHRTPEAKGVNFALETDHGIIGIAHDNQRAGSFALHSLHRPEVEVVVQVYVCHEQLEHRDMCAPSLH